MVEYTVGREIVRGDSKRLRQKNYMKKSVVVHYGIWRSVKTNVYNRYVDAQKLMEFFIFDFRAMKFESLIEKLNKAIIKVGKFEMIININLKIST